MSSHSSITFITASMAQEDESRIPKGEPTPSPPQQPSSPWQGWSLVPVLAVAALALAVSSAVIFGLNDGLGGDGGGGDASPSNGGGAGGGVPPGGDGEGGPPQEPKKKRPAPLTVAIDGEGAGTVISDPSGIECGVDCHERYPAGKQVMLRALPGKGSVFAGFSGDCSGTDPCIVTMDEARLITATFELD